MESPGPNWGMPPKVSETFTENKDSSYCQRVNFSYLGLDLLIQTTISYFIYIFRKKCMSFRYFAISFRVFVVCKQPREWHILRVLPFLRES